MQTLLYVKHGESSSKKSFNPSLLPANRLDLLPEHHAQIALSFIKQLSLATIKSRDVRILSAIYIQTIGFNKREDDMNGARLEQLTGIRPDHSNESVRRLEGLNVIVTRKGSYGKWMSVNFDLAHWGKAHPESQTNDPRCLLSEDYQTPLDLDDTEVFKLHTPPDSVDKQATIDTTEVIIEQPQPLPKPSTKPLIELDRVQLPSQETLTQPIPTAKKPQTDSFEIHFPTSLATELCQKISHYLKEINIPQQAQRLVNYFADCLQKGKVRSPIAYFIGLKNRLLNNQLDLPEDSNIISERKDETKNENKKGQLKLSELRYQYQQAITDYRQLKHQIETVSNEKICTFQQALEQIGYTITWEKADQKLEKIKQSLQIYYQEDVGIPNNA
jgi:phage replication O-like protein O